MVVPNVLCTRHECTEGAAIHDTILDPSILIQDSSTRGPTRVRSENGTREEPRPGGGERMAAFVAIRSTSRPAGGAQLAAGAAGGRCVVRTWHSSAAQAGVGAVRGVGGAILADPATRDGPHADTACTCSDRKQ